MTTILPLIPCGITLSISLKLKWGKYEKTSSNSLIIVYNNSVSRLQIWEQDERKWTFWYCRWIYFDSYYNYYCEDYSAIKPNISSEAYLISNKSYEHIFETLNNPEKQSNLIEGKEAEIKFFSLRVSDDENSAYLVVETSSKENNVPIWHSIFFRLNENNMWQILGWHKS